jgi:hypothetical protein
VCAETQVGLRAKCQILANIGMCGQILVKFGNIKFHENPFIYSRVVSWRQTDRNDETNRRTFAFSVTRAAKGKKE